MFCPGCGKEVSGGDAFCRFCGHSLSSQKLASTESVEPASAGSTVARHEESVRRSGEATASLILGLFSFIPIVALLAVIFGHLAKGSIRRSRGRLLGEGLAQAGLILGYLGLGGWSAYAIMWIITTSPGWPPNLRAANEASAISSLKTLNTAEVTYAAIYNSGFTDNLNKLGAPAEGRQPDANNADLLDPVMCGKILDARGGWRQSDTPNTFTRAGYRFTYTPSAQATSKETKKKGGTSAGRKSVSRVEAYTIHADPLTPGETGERYFFTDESGIIRAARGKRANADSLPI